MVKVADTLLHIMSMNNNGFLDFCGLTGVLCLWLYASCFSDSHHCYCMRDDCGDILLAEC